MYIVLFSSEGNGAGEAFGPFNTKRQAEAFIEKNSRILDEQDELPVPATDEQRWNSWNRYIWLDAIKIENPNNLEKRL